MHVMSLRRRDVLKLAAGGALAAPSLAAPSIARADGPKVLRFVPQANLSSLDAVAGTQYVVRNAAAMVWETLYGVDSSFTPHPQMCEGHEASADFKTWTFKLRPGLVFHDGEAVTTRDVLASLTRWMVRDTMGQQIHARLDALEAIDDRTFRFRLNRPFTKLLFALGKSNAPMALIMPERVAKTDPFQLIKEYVGSGPMRFRTDEWVPGSRAVFEQFAGYKPREEKADWLSGGKRMLFERIEWQILPDPATAGAALQSGEVDWWELPIPDLVPLLKNNKDIVVDIADPLGNIGSLRMNHLFPPFNDPRARHALLLATSQADYMESVCGGDDSLWKATASYFTPGTPLFTEDGGEQLKGPRNYELAKRLLAESGYNGEKVILMVATDVSITKAEGDVTADMLGKIGMNVDYQALDWGTVGARRSKKDPPGKGGWNIFHTWHAGADCINPAPYTALDAGGAKAWFGWPDSPAVEAGIAAWYDAADLAAEKAAAAAINRAAFEDVVYVPTGFFRQYQAWRRDLSGVVKAPFPVFWGVQKA
jgi:peptide/nickel transport system substrate-binding protein